MTNDLLSETLKIVDNSNQQTSPATSPSGKAPWPWWATLTFSFDLVGGYIIVWQNLKRMGREDVAKKFLFVGGGIVLTILVLLVLLGYLLPESSTLSSSSSTYKLVLGWLFPIWLYLTYLKKWQQENPGKAKFSWSILGWMAVGIVIEIVLIFLSFILFMFLKPTSTVESNKLDQKAPSEIYNSLESTSNLQPDGTYISPIGFSFKPPAVWNVKEETLNFEYTYDPKSGSVTNFPGLWKPTDKNTNSTRISTGVEFFNISIIKTQTIDSVSDKDFKKIAENPYSIYIFLEPYFDLFKSELLEEVEEIYQGKKKPSDPITRIDDKGEAYVTSGDFGEGGQFKHTYVIPFKNNTVWGLTSFESGNSTGATDIHTSKLYHLFDTNKNFFIVISYPVKCTGSFDSYNDFLTGVHDYDKYFAGLKAALPGCDENSEYKKQTAEFLESISFR